ncbi:putative quinol monooxygenase [Sphaerisporangium sp. TRM90804]|uniref:putative quinol monooxygenase n=1 Tax=Sphaerisporangium sp. TRM90804 TaxID=3031113 RepID=UPI0024499156|nr:putative quinol monooxygenase [Sphaerisporangium sp. TRM90804]MDH2425085.1 putative quinol monooxygenase [Sphaerisporangium sp. TRM90804]
MLLTVIKFNVRPGQEAAWLSLIDDVTQATRAEPGNVLVEWSKSVTDPQQYTVVEGYTDSEAIGVHTDSEHFKAAMAGLPDLIAGTPEIISGHVEQDGWSPMPGAGPHPQ